MDKSAAQWMVTPLRKYAEFGGRARRKEYWWYLLAVGLVTIPLAIGDVMILGFETYAAYGSGPLTGLLGLALFLPSLGVTIRRLHDHDRSGWWILLALLPIVGALVLLFWYASRGTIGANRYGPDPLTGE
jgi:uncharacterized membrane protein YhaH (DUF805 family)